MREPYYDDLRRYIGFPIKFAKNTIMKEYPDCKVFILPIDTVMRMNSYSYDPNRICLWTQHNMLAGITIG